MAVIGLLVAIPATLLVGGGGSSVPPPPAEIEVTAPEVGPKRVDESSGIELREPEGWTRKRKGDVLELRSRDRSARVALSAPGPAQDAGRIHSQVLSGLRDAYGDLRVVRKIKRARVGGLRGRATIATGSVERKGVEVPQRLAVTTAAGKRRAYLVVVFTGREPTESVLEAQTLLNTLSFTK